MALWHGCPRAVPLAAHEGCAHTFLLAPATVEPPDSGTVFMRTRCVIFMKNSLVSCKYLACNKCRLEFFVCLL